jgi:hypothetical protein
LTQTVYCSLFVLICQSVLLAPSTCPQVAGTISSNLELSWDRGAEVTAMLARSDNHSQARAQQLRSRAAEIRSAAEGMQSIPARTTMLHIAETYDRLANHLDSKPEAVEREG